MAKYTYRKEIVKTNILTGEVVEQTEEEKYTCYREPDFVKVYIDAMLMTMGHSKPSLQADVLLCLAKNMTYANEKSPNCVFIHPALREEICNTCHVSNGTLSNLITSFTRSGVLKRIRQGYYQINPNLIVRGNWNDVVSLQIAWNEDEIRTRVHTNDKSPFQD